MRANYLRPLVIAAIGDSVTAGFHIDSELKMFLRMWLGKKNSWFSEITRKISQRIPVVEHNYSTAGSMLLRRTLFDRLVNSKSMEIQCSELLRLDKFPDMVLIWIGHNELNWVIKGEKDFSNITAQFYKDFWGQLERLCVRALQQNQKIAIVVFSFINIRVLFQLREIAATMKKQNQKLFPCFDKSYTMFESIRPKYTKQTIALADMMNATLADAVALCQNKYSNDKFHITYSDSLSKLTTDSLECVTVIDGWHPSAEGHRQLADTALPVVEEQLKFLGYTREIE